MKSSIILAAASLFSFSAASPTRRDEDPAWSFSVYQSHERCTGARDPYSGNGSQECSHAIRNGSFGSYTRGRIRDDCSIYIYNNGDCNPESIIDILTSAKEEGCKQPQLEVSGAASFRVECKN
ncbi:hypothetical protein PWT90_10246 [Aphanocladium album]|nr:hypothetical protein PWT90_10246 [Aphanocladium album]